MTFDALIAPHGTDVFLTEIVGESSLYVEGSPQKFDELFSWVALNRLLEFGALAFPRLRLAVDGQELPQTAYLRSGASGYPRPRVQEINAALRAGATLVIESIEELHPPISRLCQALEGALEVPVQADMYIGGRCETRSALRWNEHDVFVMQVDGTKAWRLYCPTGSHPLPQSPQPEPTAKAAWDGSLHPGDLLYVPRGWWYSDETSGLALYLALKFRNPVNLDVLRFYCDRSVERADLRRDCPRFGGPTKVSAFIEAMRAAAEVLTTRPGLLNDFLNAMRESSAPRVCFNLPRSAGENALPPSRDHLAVPLLRFPRADAIQHAPEQDVVAIFFDDKMTRLRPDEAIVLAIMLERPCDQPALSIRALLDASVGNMSRERALESLSQLIKLGVVGLREPDAEGSEDP